LKNESKKEKEILQVERKHVSTKEQHSQQQKRMLLDISNINFFLNLTILLLNKKFNDDNEKIMSCGFGDEKNSFNVSWKSIFLSCCVKQQKRKLDVFLYAR
jgi:hypothetical protein